MRSINSISTLLRQGQDGIWYAKDTEYISYPTQGNEACFAVEDNSFWFAHRNDCIVSAVNAFPPSEGKAVFDIGGGNGFVSAGLIKAGYRAVLVEPGAVGCMQAKKRGIEDVICATTNTAQFVPGSMPAVGLFDVIEHIEDDLTFLKSIYGLVEAGGYLYATVPAYSFLWSQADVTAGHFRRYTQESISAVLSNAGFEIEFVSCIFRFLPLPVFLLRALPYKLGISGGPKSEEDVSRDHATEGGAVKLVLDALLKPEIARLKKKKPMGFGGSCLIVARKPAN